LKPVGVLLPFLAVTPLGGCVTLRVDDRGPARMLYAGGRHDSAAGRSSGAFRAQYTAAPVARGLRFTGAIDGAASASLYACVGMSLDLHIEERWVLHPDAGFGYYHRGRGPSLGGPWHFRTGGSLSYVIDDGLRVGLAWHHISNLGMRPRNPGQEQLMLQIEIPLGPPAKPD